MHQSLRVGCPEEGVRPWEHGLPAAKGNFQRGCQPQPFSWQPSWQEREQVPHTEGAPGRTASTTPGTPLSLRPLQGHVFLVLPPCTPALHIL